MNEFSISMKYYSIFCAYCGEEFSIVESQLYDPNVLCPGCKEPTEIIDPKLIED